MIVGSYMKSLLRNTITFIRNNPKVDIAFVLLALGVFATIAFFNITRASIWFDEAFSAYIIQFNFLEIAQYTAADVHPPFYYWVLKVWTMLFGTTEVAVRSMSVFFGGVVIVLAWLLARRLFGRLIASVTLLFLVISPMFIRYSDEARMYTLAATIIFIATHVLLKAVETNKRSTWVVYGLLVGLGMWTHYFTALAWLAHWVWRAIVIRRGLTKPKTFLPKFFTKNWIIAHVVAIAFYLPWLPFMALQLGGIQGQGFWISPISADSFTNYFTNYFYYLEHGQVLGWWALALVFVLVTIAVLSVRTYKSFNRENKRNYLLVAVIAFAPGILLFLASLPPLTSSYVERYLFPASIGLTIFIAATIVVGSRKWRPVLRIGLVALVCGMMVYGITNVYYFGNYNKNSNQHILTREVVEDIQSKAKPGEPIIANSPWVFYEAVFYSTDEHPVYFIDKDTEYYFGSLDMLKYNDKHKIKDIDAFMKQHPTVWYIGNSGGELEPAESNWKKIQEVTATSPVNGATLYRATQFTIN